MEFILKTTIFLFFFSMFFSSCDDDASGNCIGCSDPNSTTLNSVTPYCIGMVFHDDANIAPNYDGMVLTQTMMDDIVNNSNGWCEVNPQ